MKEDKRSNEGRKGRKGSKKREKEKGGRRGRKKKVEGREEKMEEGKEGAGRFIYQMIEGEISYHVQPQASEWRPRQVPEGVMRARQESEVNKSKCPVQCVSWNLKYASWIVQVLQILSKFSKRSCFRTTFIIVSSTKYAAFAVLKSLLSSLCRLFYLGRCPSMFEPLQQIVDMFSWKRSISSQRRMCSFYLRQSCSNIKMHSQ